MATMSPIIFFLLILSLKTRMSHEAVSFSRYDDNNVNSED